MKRLWGARLAPTLSRTADYPQAGFRQRVRSFESPYKAVVSGPGGRRDLALSSTPLEASGGGPIDLRLRSSGGGFAPAAAAVQLSIGSEISAGVRLPSLGIGVSMASAAASPGALVDRAGVIYPNVAADTDGLVTPLANGVELLALLRSPLSPEQFRYRLTLPAGGA